MPVIPNFSHYRHCHYRHRSHELHPCHCRHHPKRCRLRRRRGGECIWWIHVEFVSVCGQSLRQRGLGSVSQWVMGWTGGLGCHDSHLCVSHWGLAGRVSISGGGRVGPIFCWGFAVDSWLVDGLLGQGSHRHQGIGLVLLVYLERFSLRKAHRQHWYQSSERFKINI